MPAKSAEKPTLKTATTAKRTVAKQRAVRPSAVTVGTPARGTAKGSATAKPETLEHLLATYRSASDQVTETGHAPIQEFEGRFVEAGQRMVFLRSTDNAGKADTRQAVFVHGLGGSARNWTDLMYLLSPVVGGIAPDLPGFGRSPMPVDRDYSQAAHAQAVIRLIEDRCDGPVDLFGNSMGGAISIRIAALRPDLVRSLVLVSPALPDFKPRLSVAPLIAMTAPVISDVTKRVLNTEDPEATVDRMHNVCYLDPQRVHPERRDVQVEETRWRMGRENAADPLRLSAPSIPARATRLLVVLGREG